MARETKSRSSSKTQGGTRSLRRGGGGDASRRAQANDRDWKTEIAESGETPVDEAAAAERADREDLLFLGREFLSWLVYHAESAGGAFAANTDAGVDGFSVRLGGKLVLRTPAGAVTDVMLKGPAPSSSADFRYALAGGLAVKEADLVLEQGDRAWTFALAAEHFDLKRVKLPSLLAEEEEEKRDERIALLDALDAAVRVAFAHFLALRMKPAWTRSVLPAMRAWLDEGT